MTRIAPSADLSEIRSAIDGIDEQIVQLIAKRQNWVLKAGALKGDESAVRAPDRVDQVIAKVTSLAKEAGASPDVVESAYRALVEAFIHLELDHHRRR